MKEAGVPYIGNDASVGNIGLIQDGGIVDVLFVVGAGPNRIDFTDDMVIEEDSGAVLDGFNVDVENVAEVQFDDLGSNGAQIGACSGIQTHADFDEECNGHGVL